MAVSIGVGAQGAAAAPSPSSAGAKIAAIATSTRLAATDLQHAPNVVRQFAADAILFQSISLLAPHPAHHGGLHFAARHAAVAHSAAIPIPGTVVGGLVLNSYCQSLGFDHSMLIGNIVLAPGAAFNWVCVTAAGAQTPIDMQAACVFQYPGQVTIAYPQDVNDGFSWVCIAPTTGSFTDPTTGTTVTTLITANGAVTLITSPTGASVTFDYNGSSGTVVQDPNGGYISCDGAGGTLPVLTFEGGGSTLPVLAENGSGGTLPI
jgi:hypothetical protein